MKDGGLVRRAEQPTVTTRDNTTKAERESSAFDLKWKDRGAELASVSSTF